MAARLTAYIVVAIVAVTLIAGLIVGAQRDDYTGPVDLIIYNGRVYTAGPDAEFAEAAAIRGNQILRVGSNREIKRLARRQTTVLDAHGGAVLPGFNDSHLHLLSGGLGLDHADLVGARTLAEIQQTIAEFAAAHPDRPWVLGRGWYYEPFPGALPTRQQLDAAVPDRPAAMVCYDGHTLWVNTAALKAAGITRQTPNPPNGLIVKDPRTGEPTGVLQEAAMDLVRRVQPPVERSDRLRAIRSAIHRAHALGVTSVQNAGGSPDDLELFDEVRQDGDLALRVYSALSVRPGFTDADADRFDAVRRRFPDDPLLKAGAVKIMADGVIEARTAALLQPYATRPTRGHPNFTPEELPSLVTMLDRRGWQVLIHAIGDAAVRMALDAFEAAAQANPAPAGGRRHRIEHIETIDPADVPRFGALGVIAAMQPFHGNPATYQIPVWEQNLGPERASRGWAYRSIQEAGGQLAFGSDWPVVGLDPRAGLFTAVNRTTRRGTPEGGWYPDEKLPLAAAIDAYTSGAAYASFDDHRKGRLAPGMLADLVILSADVFELTPARLFEAVVDVTIFDGQIVYRREAGETNPEP